MSYIFSLFLQRGMTIWELLREGCRENTSHWKWDENSCSVSYCAAKQGRNPDVKNMHEKNPGSLVEQSLCRKRSGVVLWKSDWQVLWLFSFGHSEAAKNPASSSPAALRAVEMVEECQPPLRQDKHPLKGWSGHNLLQHWTTTQWVCPGFFQVSIYQYIQSSCFTHSPISNPNNALVASVICTEHWGEIPE